MSEEIVDVAVLDTHIEAEDAVKQLQRSGFNLNKVAIVDLDYHTEEKNVGYYNASDRMAYWGKLGAYWGGMAGVLFGPALFIILRIGLLVDSGSLVSAIVGGFLGAVVLGWFASLCAGLYSLAIPRNSIVTFETFLKSEKFVLEVHGSAAELTHARDVLKYKGHGLQAHAA